MKNRPKPYIGITGFTEASQVREAIAGNDDAYLMIGLLASEKTIIGASSVRYPNRYPKCEDLGNVFTDSPNTLNLIHFNTHQLELRELLLAQKLAGPYAHGFQFNIPWPDMSVLGSYRNIAEPERNTLVLQCGAAALDSVGRDPRTLAARVSAYGGLVDYVLVDPSGGLGKEFDVQFAHDCFAEFEQTLPASIGYGIAGGLRPGNLGRCTKLVEEGFKFSVDVETGVRDENDHFDPWKTRSFISGMKKMLQ